MFVEGFGGRTLPALLAAMPAAAGGAKTLCFTNPVTGGAVMPSLDCYAQRLTRNAAKQARRTTWNAICIVVAGAGRSTVGDKIFSWEQHDVFTIPHWTWASHVAAEADADLFIVTDRSVFEHLGLVREEVR